MQTAVGQMEVWFNMIMKRASQRFALQMRIWTIVFAFMIAFGTHMDSLRILQQLWTSPGLRSGLVSQREALIGEAAVVLSSQKGAVQSGDAGVSPQILVDAMKRVIAKEKEGTAGLGTIQTFNSLEQAVQWLRDDLKVKEGRKKVLIGEYHDLVLDELKERADDVTQELRKAGFELKLPASWEEFLHYDGLSNILGILMSATFLSLGAPFWFNALKTLSNLRPLVATRQEEKR